jgi:hypothetical protein
MQQSKLILRQPKLNEQFNPFSHASAWVIKSDLVDVVKTYSYQPIIKSTFQKTYKRYGRTDLTAFARYERAMLLRLHEDRVHSVAKLHKVQSETAVRPATVTSYDAGPSLESWLHVDVVPHGGNPGVHPLSSPKALVQILRNLLLVLSRLHEKGFVHCNIHAGNVCLPVLPMEAKGIFLPIPEGITLIDFCCAFKRGDSLKPPDALPLQPTPSRNSPRLMAALHADKARGDQLPTEVLRLDGRIDLHALGLMARDLHRSLRPHWGRFEIEIQQEADDLINDLVFELLAVDSVIGTPMAPDLGRSLARPLANWLRQMGQWMPMAFMARGLKAHTPEFGAGGTRGLEPVKPAPPEPPIGHLPMPMLNDRATMFADDMFAASTPVARAALSQPAVNQRPKNRTASKPTYGRVRAPARAFLALGALPGFAMVVLMLIQRTPDTPAEVMEPAAAAAAAKITDDELCKAKLLDPTKCPNL